MKGKTFRRTTHIGKRDMRVGQLRTQVDFLRAQKDAKLSPRQRAAIDKRLTEATRQLEHERKLAAVTEAAHRLNAPGLVVENLDSHTIVAVPDSHLDSDAAYDSADKAIKVAQKHFDRMVDAVQKLDANGAVTPEQRLEKENYARRAISYIALIGAHEAKHASDDHSGRATTNEAVIQSEARMLFAGADTQAKHDDAKREILKTYTRHEEVAPYALQEETQRKMGARPEKPMTLDPRTGERIGTDEAVENIIEFMPDEAKEQIASDLAAEFLGAAQGATGAAQATGRQPEPHAGAASTLPSNPGWRIARGVTLPPLASLRTSSSDAARPGWRIARGSALPTTAALATGTSDAQKPGWRIARGSALPASASHSGGAGDTEKPGWRIAR